MGVRRVVVMVVPMVMTVIMAVMVVVIMGRLCLKPTQARTERVAQGAIGHV